MNKEKPKFEKLKNADFLIISAPNNLLKDDEKEVLINYVKEGGKLFFMGDDSFDRK